MSTTPNSPLSWTASASRACFGILVAILLVCLLLALRAAPGGGAEGDVRTLRVAHALSTQHPVHRGLERFAERLAELSGGRLRATLFANGQLGSETQYLEQLQAGTLDVAKVSAGALGNFLPAFQVFSLPFFFPDQASLWRALDGPVGAELLHTAIRRRGDGSASGLDGLAFYDAGARSFYAKAPIEGPESLRGRKWRVMADVIAMDMVESIGGAPTPIAFAELYSALAQGVVDGAENNPPSLLNSRHYETCTHYALTEHSIIPDLVLISARTRTRLSEREQAWLDQAARESALYQREVWARETAAALDTLRGLGVVIVQPDRAAFTAASSQVRAKYEAGPLGEWTRRLTAAMQEGQP